MSFFKNKSLDEVIYEALGKGVHWKEMKLLKFFSRHISPGNSFSSINLTSAGAL